MRVQIGAGASREKFLPHAEAGQDLVESSLALAFLALVAAAVLATAGQGTNGSLSYQNGAQSQASTVAQATGGGAGTFDAGAANSRR